MSPKSPPHFSTRPPHTSIVRWLGAISVILTALLSPEVAHAACTLDITNLKSTSFRGHSGQGYEVFDKDQHSEIIEFTVNRRSGACDFIVGVSDGQGTDFDHRRLKSGGSELAYQLYKDIGATRVLKDVPLSNSDNVISGSLSSGQDSVTFQVYFIIPMQQIVRPGTYRDSVRISVYEGSLQSPQLRDQTQLNLTSPVPTTSEFCMGDVVDFSPSTRTACIHFGELSKGEVRHLMLHARSNAGYRITMRSQNGSVMKILDPKDSSAIAYTLHVDGQAVSLESKAAVTTMQKFGLTTPVGDEHDLRFTVGDIGQATAGDYQDVIEVTLYPTR